MPFSYGYEMDTGTGVGHLVVPPLLSTKLTIASGNNTSKWVFVGTRKEILDWMREHSQVELENGLFKPTSFHTHTELVIDLQYYIDSEQSYMNYAKSFFVSDYDVERVRVEIRPRIESKDRITECLCRTVIKSGTKLGDIVDDLEAEWNAPAKSYYQQTVDVFTEAPPPTHVLSADPPSSIQVGTDQ
ncbi:hypothetical protein DM01DRAFT_1333610 [Hesseltinella vesiculosa]|uniref:Uncharacterized protein n=1 Tax=Hesseltinella vesiculosa TaxID=101127 RepID=A0A1X2GQN0_9FUNG|nr:hypothetical protein DM01DRAFT_1333610 [Hesseltinella vesiculosa]